MKNEPLFPFFRDAMSLELLTVDDIARFQAESLTHLAFLVESFTRGESSSVRKETAEEIVRSQYYTVALYLKKTESIQETAAKIREEPFAQLYAKGRRLLEKEIIVARIFTERARGNILPVGNCFYRETLDKGLPLFFQKYDPDYFAHETPGGIDYPLATDVFTFSGVELIQAYSESLFLEN